MRRGPHAGRRARHSKTIWQPRNAKAPRKSEPASAKPAAAPLAAGPARGPGPRLQRAAHPTA
eukprot:2245226-Alexandrium_andersonii.AAC.1